MAKKPTCYFTRRQLLAMSGVAGALPFFRDPVAVALRSLSDGLITSAQAADTRSGQPKNYVFLYLPTGIPRWYFDQLLKTAKSDPKFVHNPQVNTRFDWSTPGAVTPVYDTVTSPANSSGTTYEFPYLWASQIPTSSGSTVPMSSLMKNMMVIRGVNMLADSHPLNAMKQIQPVTGGPSINALVAQASNRPVPTISDNSTTPNCFVAAFVTPAYHSPLGIGMMSYNRAVGTDLLTQILHSFDRSGDALPSTFMSRRQALDSAIQQGLSSLASFAASSQPGSSSLYASRSNAEALMRSGLTNVSGSYSTLFSKYNSLVKACVTMPRAGVTDAAVPYSALPTTATHPTTGQPVQLTDGLGNRTMSYVNNTGLAPTSNQSSDLRNMITSSLSVGGLAEGFAVAEYMLVQKYSSAVTIGFDYPTGMNYEKPMLASGSTAGPATVIGNGQWVNDEHFTGAATSLVVNSYLFQSVAACLYEFINQLKAAGIWDNTVIQIASEFSRTPKADASGADHGWMANLCTVMSGAIPGPIVVGNTTVDTIYGYGGSYGMAGTVNHLDGPTSQLLIGNVASTVTSLLGVITPTPNNASVFTIDSSGRFTPRIGMENV